MPQVDDATAERLRCLTVELRLTLLEARILRIRFKKAKEANVWPTIPSFVSFAAGAPIEPN